MTIATPTTTQLPPAVAAPGSTTSPLKLSEAIRLGAMSTAQAFSSWDELQPDGRRAVCGIGAAQLALGLPVGGGGPLNDLLGQAPAPACPGGVELPDCTQRDLASTVMHLNDDHHWPRERTADWLEQLGL